MIGRTSNNYMKRNNFKIIYEKKPIRELPLSAKVKLANKIRSKRWIIFSAIFGYFILPLAPFSQVKQTHTNLDKLKQTR